MRRFLTKCALYFSILIGTLLIIGQFDNYPEEYKFKEIRSPYIKIPWIYNMITDPDVQIDGIFLGASVTRGGIVDSLIVNKYGLNFYNFGVNHPCRALSHLLLTKTLAHKKPKYVFLDILAMTHRNTHSMYPILEEGKSLRQFAGDNRTFARDYLKSIAYKIHFITRIFKRDKLNLSTESSNYGYIVDDQLSPEEISSKLDRILHPGKYRGKLKTAIRESVLKYLGDNFIENCKTWINELTDFTDNSAFQRLMLMKSIDLLKKNNIPYYFIFYPVHPGRGRNEELLADFIEENKDLFPDDAAQNILTISDEEKINRHELWSDLQHLNEKGAIIFTTDIMDKYLSLKSVSDQKLE